MQAKVADFGSVGQILREALVSARKRPGKNGSRGDKQCPTSHPSAVDLTFGVGTPAYMSIEALSSGAYNQVSAKCR